MADMDVVWKRRSNVAWLWILIALIVGALWFVFSGGSARSTSTGQLAVPSDWRQHLIEPPPALRPAADSDTVVTV